MAGAVAALHLPRALRERIAHEALAAAPRECCGLIEGVREADDTLRATVLHPTPNLAAEPDRFEIDPAAHIALLRALRGTGREILGCYHSHPGGAAELSVRDRQTVTDDGFVWLLAAANGGIVNLAAFACPPGRPEFISPVPLAPIV
ncbi:MAG: M67 family metallopeptidase [Rhizomicrobium sp.]